LTERALARAHSAPILSAFVEQQELLAIAKAVKALVSETSERLLQFTGSLHG
jgi:hypothetical protein